MLYYASINEGPQWLAVGELAHITDDARSHEQPCDRRSPDIMKLYKRAMILGGRPQIYSIVRTKDYQEIERLLTEEPEALATNPGGDDTADQRVAEGAGHGLGPLPFSRRHDDLQKRVAALTESDLPRGVVRGGSRRTDPEQQIVSLVVHPELFGADAMQA